MDDLSQNGATHLNGGNNLPAIPMAVPAVEVIKQILEQMLANERRRVRNEFIRISAFFLVLLLMVMAGGFWIARDILIHVKEARLMSEHSQEALLTLLSASDRQAPAKPVATPDEDPSEIQKVIAEMEDNNKALAELMQSQDGNLKNLLLDVLQTRDHEIQNLRARVNSKQAGAIASVPVDLDAIQAHPPAKPEPPAFNITLPDRPPVKTLTATVANDLPLRLPIPAP